MSKGLIQIRNGIDEIYGELIGARGNEVLTVNELIEIVKKRLDSHIEQFQAELIDSTIGRLIHEVGRRKGDKRGSSEFADLFSDYKRIPQSLLVEGGARKPTAKLSIPELKSYLSAHSPRVVNRHHEELFRVIEDCQGFALDDDDTLEVLLGRRAMATGRPLSTGARNED